MQEDGEDIPRLVDDSDTQIDYDAFDFSYIPTININANNAGNAPVELDFKLPERLVGIFSVIGYPYIS